MDRKGRKWSQSSGPGQTGTRGASPDETSSTSEDPISRLTAIATTLSSELVPPPTGSQPRSAAQTTPVQIKPEPMDVEEKPSCRFARKGEGVMFTLPGPSGEGATSESVPVSPSMWQPSTSNMKNADVASTKLPSYEEEKLHNTRRSLSTPPSHPLSGRSHRSPTSRFPPPFTFSRHPMSPSADDSQHTRSVCVASSTATLTSGSSLQGGEQHQSLQQDRQQLQRLNRFFPSGASAADMAEAGPSRQQRDLIYQQQLLFVMKRLHRFGIRKDVFGRGQEAGTTQSQLDQQRQSQSVHRAGQSREHAAEVGSGNQVGQQEMTSQGSNTRISGGPATVTSGQSQVQGQQVSGFFKHPPIRARSSPTGTSLLSGMLGLQTASQHGGAVRCDTTIRQLLPSRTNPPYPNLGPPIHQLHHQQQRYVQQQHHHHQQIHKPLSMRFSDGSASAKPVTVVQRRYSAPPHTTDVVMKEEIVDQFSTPSGATPQLTEGTRAMESTGPEGLEPPSFPQKDLNQNISTTSNRMYSTGEICVVPPTPINDPDAIRLEEISMGSTLLDLDHIQQQQRQARYDGPSPSPSFSGGFGLPPSPDMQGSFYPEQVHLFQAQQMGPTIQQAGGDQMSEIDENEMMRLIMREMIPGLLDDCRQLNLVPNLYYWSSEDVQKWLACVISRFDLEAIEMGNFYFDGTTLASLQDSDFRQRAPKCGDILYSVVCLLKTTIHFDSAPQVVPQSPMVHHIPQPSQFHTGAPTTDMVMAPRYVGTPVSPGAKPGDESGSTGSPSDDEISIPSPPAPSGPNTSMTPNHTGGIQLWQFLKELLLQPNSYSYCIRWMDRTQGIFKIEDSVEVARLWGLRKNRPAMNYDKLSRSIRQYYRKGIMKKTEVSQRLVYQFVHPF